MVFYWFWGPEHTKNAVFIKNWYFFSEKKYLRSAPGQSFGKYAGVG